MEKSIELIWKEGFLKSDALLAPKINNLYKQKSIHIIDKFQRMFKINLIAVVVFSVVFLLLSFLVGIPYMGVPFFISMNVLVVINKHLLNGLTKIDKGANSYQYLKAFNGWIKKQVAINKRMSTFLYPFIFLSLIAGFWFKDEEGLHLGVRLVNKILIAYPNMLMLGGIPLVGIIGTVVIVGILAVLGGRIYQWDLNMVYGRVFRKLEELMADIEGLRT